jgi:hypothetical protein
MATYEINGKTIYIDGRLKEKLDRDVIPELNKRDMDTVFAVSGRERSGKSTMAQAVGGYIAKQLGTKFDLSNICMNPDELRKRIETAQKKEVIIYDEAHRGMASSRSLSEINNILRDLFMEMGQLNLCVFVVLPSFFMLDKYIAIDRTRGLFYIYMNKGVRGFWVYFGERDKKKVYFKGKKLHDMNCMKWPDFRGRFTKHTPIDEDEYRKKKHDSFVSRERIGKVAKLMAQRDALILFIRRKTDFSQQTIAEWLEEYGASLTHQDISLIEAKNTENLANMQLATADL